jgi:DNA transformation protein
MLIAENVHGPGRRSVTTQAFCTEGFPVNAGDNKASRRMAVSPYKPDQTTTHILELLTPLGPVMARRMFGGVGLYLHGTMFGLIARDELYLKVGHTNQPDYEAAGEAPFRYETKNGTNTIRSYWRCPPGLLDDADALHSWARRAIGAAIAAARAKPKPRGQRRKP